MAEGNAAGGVVLLYTVERDGRVELHRRMEK